MSLLMIVKITSKQFILKRTKFILNNNKTLADFDLYFVVTSFIL